MLNVDTKEIYAPSFVQSQEKRDQGPCIKYEYLGKVTTYLCFTDDSCTGYHTALILKGSLRLTSPCFVVYLLP